MKFLIVGAGFSGAVLARELVSHLDCTVLVVDERNHIAGNCHTYRDEKTNIMVHAYGPHIFNTNREDVWKYVNQYAEFGPFVNRVKAVTHSGIYSLPINLLTINQFFGKHFSPDEARAFIAAQGDKTIEEPANFEQQALKFIGKDLYEAFFYGYTKKQWGCEPSELPASVLKRLPVRFNYDDNYYSTKFQGIPKEGYTAIFEKILHHKAITVELGEHYERGYGDEFEHVFYSGPIDGYFQYEKGRLGYRTVTFERIKEAEQGDYQGNALLNYTEEKVSHTRIREDKYFTPWETHEKTIAWKEYSKETERGDTPYYPKHLLTDKALLNDYIELVKSEEGVSFIGRLGTYRYLNMDQVIGETLDFASDFIKTFKVGTKNGRPKFSTQRLS